jgi:hypothetical protein
MIRHPLLATLLGSIVLLFVAARSPACPFCSQAGKTLLEEINDADMVMYGSLKNPRQDPDQTDFEIESVVKKHEAVAGKKMITLEKYIAGGTIAKDKRWLIFCTMFKGRIDLYMAQAVDPNSGIDKYLIQALKYQDRKEEPAKRLRFFFDYLDNAEPEIANDALKEWSFADYKDYRDLAKDLPADKLSKWLADPKTAPHRIGLYASLLGHCGKAEHIALLQGMVKDPAKWANAGLDGILAGYVLLDPKEGWKAINELLGKRSLSFGVRNSALRAARFFLDSRPDVVTRGQVVSGMYQLLDHNDIADFVIEDFRKRDEWNALETILALDTKSTHDIAIIHRAILRYALCVPVDHDPKELAKTFVQKARDKNPEFVQDAEDLLKSERGAK